MGFLLLLHFEDELDIHAEADADPEAIEIQTPDGAIEYCYYSVSPFGSHPPFSLSSSSPSITSS
ncbi:hypothetical protein Csa_001860 [Cucumis sativus]|uniref:Uncharacterized protein n=1 Tax=Cucumis sativus TaxID=3659 RepID=A0A0A0LHP5_CUCSA|nr:hypothetical protein Csa_001860 [Cucumis sativus]